MNSSNQHKSEKRSQQIDEEDNEEQEVDIEDLDEDDDDDDEYEEEVVVERHNQSDSQNLNLDPNSNSNTNDNNRSVQSQHLTETNFQVQFSRKSKYNFSLNESVLYQDILQVNCNSVVAELHKKRFGSGGKGHCIKVLVSIAADENSHSENNSNQASMLKREKWMTPIEFENFCGKGNCRDWKRTIKVGGQPLLALLDARILICHAVSCSCGICNQNDSLVGPIRPFMKYRRRKPDEILAQNAFKKFLSLKPPTLLNENLPGMNTCDNNANNSNFGNNNNNFNNNNNNNMNTTCASVSSIATASSSNSNSPVAPSNLLLNTSVVNNLLNNSNLNNSSSNNNTNTNNNNMFNNLNNSGDLLMTNSVCSFNLNVNPDDDLLKIVQKMQENDARKWSSLEKVNIFSLDFSNLSNVNLRKNRSSK
jgi:hypothetical protein